MVMETTAQLDRSSAALLAERVTKVYADGTKRSTNLRCGFPLARSSG
jgi:hypothetical protein